MSMTDAIHAAGITVSLRGRPVLTDVDLTVPTGEFVVLLGGNGSGKTTLVRALLGLVPIQHGTVSLLGSPQARFRRWRKVGYVPQRLALPSSLPATVHEVVASGRISHVGLVRRFASRDRAAIARAMESLDLADLSHERVSDLSGGLQQRVLIARALAGEPELILLDEPVSNVDVEHQARFAELLGEVVRSGGTVLLVAHALGVMEGLASRAVVLHGGHKTYDGTPDVGEHDRDVHHHEPGGGRGLRPIGGDR